MTRVVGWEDWWGDDGETLVVFGHVDRHELAAAAEAFGRAEWGIGHDEFALDSLPRHAYAVVTSTDPHEPYLYWQAEPTHPSGLPVLPVTIAGAGSWPSLYMPHVADVPNAIEPAPVIAAGRARPTLDDRLISKVVHP